MFSALLPFFVGVVVGVPVTIAWGLLAGDLLAAWAVAVRRFARLLGASRAVVAIATGRVVVSKLPEEERKWFKRAVGQLVMMEKRLDEERTRSGQFYDAHQRAAFQNRELEASRDAAIRELEIMESDRDDERRSCEIVLTKLDRIREAVVKLSDEPRAVLVVVARVLDCPRGSPDHGLGACGCEVKA